MEMNFKFENFVKINYKLSFYATFKITSVIINFETSLISFTLIECKFTE